MMRRVVLAMILVSTTVAAADTELPVWAPDPALTKGLDQEVVAAGFRFKLPRGYQPSKQLATNRGMAYYFAGPRRRDGTMGLLAIAVLPMPRTFRPQNDADLRRVLAGGLTRSLETEAGGMRIPVKTVTRTAPEFGRVGDQVLASARWSVDVKGRAFEGFVYSTLGPPGIVSFVGFDRRHGDALPLIEASALTLTPAAAK
jgi:hypothetical protein